MKVFLANLETSLGQVYSSLEIVNRLYSSERCGKKINQLARKFSQKTGIQKRSTVVDLTRLPEKFLISKEYHPLRWGNELFKKIVPVRLLEKLGNIISIYNTTFHQNVLPSISAQIAAQLDLKTNIFPLDIPYLGCAGGLFGLQRAIELTKQTNKATFVYIFDQCSSTLNLCCDKNSSYFAKSLIANMIFSDGAVGFLILPESLSDLIPGPKIEIIDTCFKFVPGQEIYMDENVFILGDNIHKIMPNLVAKSVINPILERHQLTPLEINEWSIHQGGTKVLSEFARPKILGLTSENLQPSLDLFNEYGNFSSASCFFVLKSFFDKYYFKPSNNDLGMILGFGSGYYLGASLYRWVSDNS
ncbi:MAG: 3-oxoacyl-[acyl-carrier-protein] synthase III C-terminal domain-containing protein [Xenococcaceae cyanobacterium MO_207.B15]|nr:3-oxoacyl-[acyl-carrier-protein] synthase III C-terminal domain-containing protein [Xenococcaceae cyanobacterium MO_207.B15]